MEKKHCDDFCIIKDIFNNCFKPAGDIWIKFSKHLSWSVTSLRATYWILLNQKMVLT